MIGIDIVEIKRFRPLNRKDFSHWKNFFSEREWRHCFSRPSPSASLAGLFAAKEAVMKAVGGRYLGRFDLIEIRLSRSGGPQAILKTKKSKKVAVSISHTERYALACALSKTL